VKSSTLKERGEEKALKECEEEKARRALHPNAKMREERYALSLLCIFFSFFYPA
jgi:hypothetical protein